LREDLLPGTSVLLFAILWRRFWCL